MFKTCVGEDWHGYLHSDGLFRLLFLTGRLILWAVQTDMQGVLLCYVPDVVSVRDERGRHVTLGSSHVWRHCTCSPRPVVSGTVYSGRCNSFVPVLMTIDELSSPIGRNLTTPKSDPAITKGQGSGQSRAVQEFYERMPCR